MVTLRHLRLVAAVASEGTLTAAARRLFLTQPALSHQLADLERQVGTAIFNRIGKRLVPTAAGARLLETALETLQSLGDMERELKLFASGKIGALRVTSQCFTSYHWLPLVLPEFLALHPQVEFEIMPEFSANALAALTSGAADLALVYDPPAHKHVVSFRLFDDEMVLIAAPGHPLAAKPFVAAQDFADVHLLLHYRDPEGSSLFQRVLIPNQVTPAKVSAVRLTEAIVALAAAGIGCAVVPRWTVAPALREGKLAATRVTEAGLYRGWYALALPQVAGIRYCLDFIGLLQRGPEWLLEQRPTQHALRAG
jgi:LysR family transcriptional regulator for metE and metH